jgi:hypothetical protein
VSPRKLLTITLAAAIITGIVAWLLAYGLNQFATSLGSH